MGKKHVTLLALMIVVFLAGVGIGHETYEPKEITVIEYVEVPVVEHVFITEYQRHEIEEIAHEVATGHPYVYGVYDCEEFSHKLVRRLEARGYDADYVIGDTTFGRHAWVKVTIYVEATNGQIISPADFKMNYRVRGTFEN